MAIESRSGSVPFEPVNDADGDGMPDDWEIDNGLDPSDPSDAWTDVDNDQVVSLFEYQLGSSPEEAEEPPVFNVSPNQDLSQVLISVQSGTLVRVQGGVHAVNHITFDPKSVMIQGGWSEDFAARSTERSPTMLDGSGIDEVLYFSFDSESHAVILDGLDIYRGGGSFGAVNFIAQDSAAMKVSLRDVYLYDSENIASDNTSGDGGVLNISHWDQSTTEVTLVRAIIANNRSSGISTSATDDANGRWTVLNSVVTNNESVNERSGFGLEGFTLDGGVFAAEMKNSVFWGNQKGDLDVRRSMTITASHSDIDAVTAEFDAVYSTGSGLQNTDPIFVGVEGGNFMLKANSPLIDQGIDVGLPFVGSAPDIGAYEFGAPTANEAVSSALNRAVLYLNFPNPLTQNTTLRYTLAVPSSIRLNVYNLLGQHVATLAEGVRPPGQHSIVWDGRDAAGRLLPNGLYLYRLTTGPSTHTRKMMIVR